MCSCCSSCITGQCIAVDGGLSTAHILPVKVAPANI